MIILNKLKNKKTYSYNFTQPNAHIIVLIHFISRRFDRRSGHYQAKNDLKGKKTNTIIKKVRETLQKLS
jgi:hypothetical protein